MWHRATGARSPHPKQGKVRSQLPHRLAVSGQKTRKQSDGSGILSGGDQGRTRCTGIVYVLKTTADLEFCSCGNTLHSYSVSKEHSGSATSRRAWFLGRKGSDPGGSTKFSRKGEHQEGPFWTWPQAGCRGVRCLRASKPRDHPRKAGAASGSLHHLGDDRSAHPLMGERHEDARVVIKVMMKRRLKRLHREYAPRILNKLMLHLSL